MKKRDRRDYMAAYNRSSAGRAAQTRYNQSSKGKDTRSRYYLSRTSVGVSRIATCVVVAIATLTLLNIIL